MRWIVLLAIVCLASPGCAGLDAAPRHRQAGPEKPAEDDHITLERELGLYSD